MRKSTVLAVTALCGSLAGLLIANAQADEGSPKTGLPTPDHVVVAVFENHAYSQILGSRDAPYFNELAKDGAELSQSYAITHPSQPNYFAMFSGSTQKITDDSCYSPGFSTEPNLASELIAVGKTWGSYNEGLPEEGDTTCHQGRYARKHNPWFAFSNVPTTTAHTLDDFPTDFTRLPQVSFVVPDLCNDMHDCSVATGDGWLKEKLGAYAAWAKTHNSLLVITFDEDNRLAGNRIPTILYGEPVEAGSTSDTTYNHYDLLRTIEDMYDLGHAGSATDAAGITGIWKTQSPAPAPTTIAPGTPSGGTSPGTPGSGGTSSGNSGGSTGGNGTCTAPAWDRDTIYTGGKVVSRSGRAWKAKWWTRGNEPGSPTAYGAWEDAGSC